MRAYDEQEAEENITALGGMPLLVQALRSLGAGRSVVEHVHLKQRQRGLDEASYVESFVVLNAAGGDCLEDFEHLRADRAGSRYNLNSQMAACSSGRAPSGPNTGPTAKA